MIRSCITVSYRYSNPCTDTVSRYSKRKMCLLMQEMAFFRLRKCIGLYQSVSLCIEVYRYDTVIQLAAYLCYCALHFRQTYAQLISDIAETFALLVQCLHPFG